MEQGIFILEILVISFIRKRGVIFTPKNYLSNEFDFKNQITNTNSIS